jgi:hypothetical protein
MNDIIPEIYKNNPSARALIKSVYAKAQKEGKYVGYWSRQLTELTGIEPADEKSGFDAGNEPEPLKDY